MATAEFAIDLRGGADEEGFRRYAPGESIEGVIHVVPDDTVECRHLWVRLVWHTEGRGTRDSGRAGQVDIFRGSLRGGEERAFDFRLTAPREPWSFAGRLVSIVWEVEADLDVPWSRNPRFRQRFIVAPPWHADLDSLRATL